MKKSTDPRAKKTRKYLREALLTLIKEKGFDAITVGDLTNAAEINRATFYQHYQDKYDLLDQTIDDMLNSLGTYVAPKDYDDFTTREGIIPIHLRMFEFISEHAFFFQVMMGENGIPSFQSRLQKMIGQFMREKIDQLHPNPVSMKIPKEIIIHYISFAILGLLSYWLENDMNYSVNYMAKQLSDLTEYGPFVASGLKTRR
jgi:AcrR family transcriptional regulator